MRNNADYELKEVSIRKYSRSIEQILPDAILAAIAGFLKPQEKRILLLASIKFYILIEAPQFFNVADKNLVLRSFELQGERLQSELNTMTSFCRRLTINKYCKNLLWIAISVPFFYFLFESCKRFYSIRGSYLAKSEDACNGMNNLLVNNTTNCINDRFLVAFHAYCYIAGEAWLHIDPTTHPSVSKKCQDLYVNFLDYNSSFNINDSLFVSTAICLFVGMVGLYFFLQRSITLANYSYCVRSQLVLMTQWLPKLNANITDHEAIILVNESISEKKKALRKCEVRYSLYEKYLGFFKNPPKLISNIPDKKEELQPLLGFGFSIGLDE